MLDNLPVDLEFLNEVLGDRAAQYCAADWLKSPYHNELWKCVFGDTSRFVIDFRVRLEDGSLLTSPKHTDLLNIFKSWLCVQTHFDSTGGRILTPHVSYNRVCRTLYIIDYLLLNSDQFNLARYGLQCMTDNDIIVMLSEIACFSDVSYSIYRWPERLSAFLRGKISGLSRSEINQIGCHSALFKIAFVDVEEKMLDLNEFELIQARAWIWKAGIYHKARTSKDFEYTPNTIKLAELVYINTLKGKSVKPIPPELCLEPVERYHREFEAVPVRTNYEEKLSTLALSSYVRSLRTMGLLAEIQLPVPINTLAVLDNRAISRALDLKIVGRFRSLPQNVVLTTLRDSIEFALNYGDDLIDGYLSIVKASREEGISCQAYAKKHGISHLLSHKIRKLGTIYWTLNEHFCPVTNSHNRTITGKIDKDNFYKQLRSNKGFLELLKVLYGSIQVCTGTTMARRSGEMIDLIAKECLDISGTHLIFRNCKSGVSGNRQKEARPIPPIAARLIRMLERLQGGLIQLGVQSKYKKLFAFPSVIGPKLIGLDPTQFNSSFDIFCDYTETPQNKVGQRYYIRQHPLRRFFAMLFFWGNSFGGMETLRWFLGHTDVEHMYHYITESTPGEVLNAVKANYAAEQIKSRADEANALANLLEDRFGIRDFSILDSDELDEYIEELIDDGQVVIEPEFFTTKDGQRHRILIRVQPVGG